MLNLLEENPNQSNLCFSVQVQKGKDIQVGVNNDGIKATCNMKILGVHIDSKLDINGYIVFLETHHISN